MLPIKIYRLVNPHNGETFYVGRTHIDWIRKKAHSYGRSLTSKNKTKKDHYVIDMGCDPIFLVIETIGIKPLSKANVRESYWLNKFVSLGHPIQNVAWKKAA